MTHSTIKTTILSTLAAAVVATSFSIAPVYAGGEGGGERTSSITRHNKDGSSVTLKGKNGGNTMKRITRNRNNRVVNVQQVNRRKPTFVTIHNPDGTSRTITRVSRDRSSWASTTDPKTGKVRISGRLHLPFGVSIRFRN